MATVQESWQTKCTSISQRTKYIFNTALLSDVKFIVPMSNGESERKVIPAHKLVLVIGSPVFFARTSVFVEFNILAVRGVSIQFPWKLKTQQVTFLWRKSLEYIAVKKTWIISIMALMF